MTEYKYSWSESAPCEPITPEQIKETLHKMMHEEYRPSYVKGEYFGFLQGKNTHPCLWCESGQLRCVGLGLQSGTIRVECDKCDAYATGTVYPTEDGGVILLTPKYSKNGSPDPNGQGHS